MYAVSNAYLIYFPHSFLKGSHSLPQIIVIALETNPSIISHYAPATAVAMVTMGGAPRATAAIGNDICIRVAVVASVSARCRVGVGWGQGACEEILHFIDVSLFVGLSNLAEVSLIHR